MKKSLLFLVCCLGLVVGKAQYAPIPDTGFRYYLTSHGFSPYMNGSYIDTTATFVLNTHTINCYNYSILNLNGIQYFKNLDTLICGRNLFSSLPPLPSRLRYFDCNTNSLTQLATLPDSLTYLNCHLNLLTASPPFGSYLTYLDISSNPISSVPNFPDSITSIYCYSDNLTSLPPLPMVLCTLNCNQNKMISLPDLPPTLTFLLCSDNELTSIPELPDSMFRFYCRNNVALKCLPTLKRMVQFDFTNTAITCLPNYSEVDIIHPVLLHSLPLCDSLTPNPCLATAAPEILNPKSSFSLTPNPATNQLNISIDESLVGAQLNIYNVTGSSVQSAQLQIANSTFEIQNLPSGVYVAVVTTPKSPKGDFNTVMRRWVKMLP